MDKERFSLLLLEPGEIYFEDFSVNLLKNDGAPSVRSHDDGDTRNMGRLKMCSKSIVFDPKDKKLPIIKIPYKDCDKIERWPGNLRTSETNVLAVTCLQYIEMLEGNILAPYKFIAEKKIFLFNMHYAKVDDYLIQLCQLHRASSLHAVEQNSMISTIVFSRHTRVKFNPLWLDNIYEKVIIENQVDEINPLVVNPGRLVLTSSSIYFQPYNNIQPVPVINIKLKSLYSLIKRRFLLRHVGLEIKWKTNTIEHLLYVSFSKNEDRDNFYVTVMEQEDLNIKQTEPESMTLKWQNGLITNYDYLLYLNSLADRTFQDLTQYPVFPWVISDYTSNELDLNDKNSYRDLTKPIGALNPERLERLKERSNEMGDPKFLYGSHYSAPGLVLFYLVRKFPKLMLCLQNGRFDHPDRMFNKVDDAYKNCLGNMSDFKELIPEFYDISGKGDFLINKTKINFGTRFDGSTVNHVQLPIWAKNSPEIFTSKLREALESEYVSRNLNHWIDLIFGYKQRGEEATKSDNLFYYLCYEGSIDLDSVKDLTARHAFEVQISEFGQIPKQLFDRPHVQRIMSIPEPSVSDNQRGDKKPFPLTDMFIDAELNAHRNDITSILIDQRNIFSTGKDGLLKCYNIDEKKQMRSVSLGSLPISSCIKIPDVNTVILGSWDNTIMTYNLDYAKITNVIQAHDDAVSCLAHINEMGILVSGSWDCSIKVWKGFDKEGCLSLRISESLKMYLSLEDRISCLDVYKKGDTLKVVIGTSNGDTLLWIVSADFENFIESDSLDTINLIKHELRCDVMAVSFNFNGTKIVSCCADEIKVVDVDTRMLLFNKTLNSSLTCLDWKSSDELLFLGDRSGFLNVWDMTNGVIKFEKKIHKNSVHVIFMAKNREHFISGGKDSEDFFIKIWKPICDLNI